MVDTGVSAAGSNPNIVRRQCLPWNPDRVQQTRPVLSPYLIGKHFKDCSFAFGVLKSEATLFKEIPETGYK